MIIKRLLVRMAPSPAKSCLHEGQNKRKPGESIESTDGRDDQPRKRGKKPRSQRNRQKAKSSVHTNENLKVMTKIVPLTLGDNLTIPGVPPLVRVVEPYPYSFCSYAKARWCGRTILDVYSSEFGSYPASYYEMAIRQGRILVNDCVVRQDYTIKGGDVLCHRVHRHEPAVAVATSTKPWVKIVAETDDLVVVDKPSTIPIHPCGAYHENSLMNLLEPEFGKLYTIHRLDRLTSGLLVIAKSSGVAKEWGKAIMERKCCDKVYLARVKGRFPLNLPSAVPEISRQPEFPPLNGEWRTAPEEDSTGTCNVDAVKRRNCYGYYFASNDSSKLHQISIKDFAAMECDFNSLLGFKASRNSNDASEIADPVWLKFSCPVRIQDHKNGVCFAGTFDSIENGLYLKTVKAAETCFALLRYDVDSDSSIVVCRPTTGRTHQIRLHLQHIGHPIANDPNYGGSMWYNNPKGADACNSAKKLLEDVSSSDVSNAVAFKSRLISKESASLEEVKRLESSQQEESESSSDFIRRTCLWCARCEGADGAHRNLLEYLVRSHGIWLHALQYSIRRNGADSCTFTTALPVWAEN